MKKNVVWFETVDKNDIGLVGGKGANLGEMLTAGFPIPYGFVVTANAYFNFIKHNNLAQKISNLLSIVNFNNPKELTDISIAIKKLIYAAEVPKDLVSEIFNHYENLVARENKILHKKAGLNQTVNRIRAMYQPPLVAVRSSATAEDLPGASFAGQQETFLNVKGEHDLISKIRECWGSLFNERAIYYRHEQGFDHFKVGLAAVVQRMVQSEESGICFTIDPVTNNKKVITIEAIYGLGEYIVQGVVSPDHYEVDKNSFEILKKETTFQNVKMVRKGTKNVEEKISKSVGSKQKITDEQIQTLAKIVKKIEQHYYFPQDLEWAIEKGNIFIVQSRPITTVKEDNTKNDKVKIGTTNEVILKGDPASPGIGVGIPVIIRSPSEIDMIKKGDILVAPQTNPDYVPAMKKASAIVTERGGRTSHAAIVSRELGIPAIVGAEHATRILAKEKIISVNGETGEVYKGSVIIAGHAEKIDKIHHEASRLKTKTHVYVNLAEPEMAEKISRMNVDGIGLLRAEFMIAEIGVHPKQIIKENKQHIYINKLADSIEKFIKPFAPRPVVYRATDFKTNEYRHLAGGAAYEPREENPMIGFRGASRYIADKEVFMMELQAIKILRDKGYRNLWLMIPFIRTPAELVQIRNILQDFGLLGLPSFKLWIMVEIPSTVILLEEFIKIGIDGVSVGTNDLTMLILGVDRDNQEIAHLYNERNPAVLWALEKIVKTCRAGGVTCSVCGQAPSDYPEIVEKLVELGITSLSVNPDVIDKTRIQIAQIEEKLWQQSKK
jgi:pyruvate,water dikinase